MKMKEIIVVEGQNDINKIQSCLEVDCLKTNGTHLSKSFLTHLKTLQKTREIIVMTDDDYPGRWIRTQIQEALGNCKHAFIDKKVSRISKKVGIEHASCEEIKKALKHLITFDEKSESITWSEYIDLGFVSDKANLLREKVITYFLLPPMNSKRLFKTLNMMEINKETLERIIQ